MGMRGRDCRGWWGSAAVPLGEVVLRWFLPYPLDCEVLAGGIVREVVDLVLQTRTEEAEAEQWEGVEERAGYSWGRTTMTV